MVFVQHLMARKRRMNASRDLAMQIGTIRALLSECNHVGKTGAAQRALDNAQGEAFAAIKPNRSLFDPEELADRLKWAQGLAGESKAVVLRHLYSAESLGPLRTLSQAPTLDVIDAIQRDFPHCGQVIDIVRRRIALSRCSPSRALSLPPLLLNGPPGTGKTALAQRLANAFAAPYHRVDMASAGTVFAFVGLDIGYSTGRPGLIWCALQHACMSPVFLLDEIDKAGQGTDHNKLDSFLLGLLEPVTATRFQDAAIGLSVDASRIIWLATCNSTEMLHPALLSRFAVVDIACPNALQMPAVIASIHKELMATADWAAAFDPAIAQSVVGALSNRPPRAVRQALEDAYANAAAAGRRQPTVEDVPSLEQERGNRTIGFTN